MSATIIRQTKDGRVVLLKRTHQSPGRNRQGNYTYINVYSVEIACVEHGPFNWEDACRWYKRHASKLPRFELYWAPEGKLLATVEARTARAAKRKAPVPYVSFPGEIYVKELP
jgi:hypothetical protein